MQTENDKPGRVLEVQRMSTEDGPGIRTTVFLKGCTLACRWCHNPESIASAIEFVWHEWKCMGCGDCVRVCPENARRLDADGARRDMERCVSCGTCVAECPTTAIEALGRPYSVEELLTEVLRDWSYYESSGGGVTVSGGEPALQAPFVRAFLRACRARGLHTALDTCGLVATAPLLSLVDEADLVLFDVKEIDPERHRAFTGHDNVRVLENLGAVAARARAREGRPELWIRTPLIPGDTATEENLQGIGRFLAENVADVVSRWELCAFNDLCQDQYRRLGRVWPYEGRSLLCRGELARFEDIARRSGVAPDIVIATGRTKADPAPPSTADRRTPTC